MTGIVRRIDDLGRVAIPKEFRRVLNIRENDPLEILADVENKLIVMSPYDQINYREMWEDLRSRKVISKETVEEIEKYYSRLL